MWAQKIMCCTLTGILCATAMAAAEEVEPPDGLDGAQCSDNVCPNPSTSLANETGMDTLPASVARQNATGMLCGAEPPMNSSLELDSPETADGGDRKNLVRGQGSMLEQKGTCLHVAKEGPEYADAEVESHGSPAEATQGDQATEAVSEAYTMATKTGAKWVNLPVVLPEDPMRPQDSRLRDAEVAEELYEPLEKLNKNKMPSEELINSPGVNVLSANRTSHHESPSFGGQARVDDSEPTDPPSNPSTSPMTSGDPAPVWTPNPAESAVLAAAIAGGLVLVLAFIGSHLRTCASLVRRALRGVLLAPMLVRIKSHKAIEDPKRRVLYNLIHENPGISIKELCEAAGMSRSAVNHQLLVVSRAGLIASENIGRGRHYYPAVAGLDRRRRMALALLRADRNRDLLHVIQENPGITLTRLVKSRGLHASQAHQILTCLHEAGLVERNRIGTSVQYQVAHAQA